MKKMRDIVRNKIVGAYADGQDVVRMAEHWQEIAGQELSRHSFPARLVQNGENEKTLTVVLLNNSFAIELYHRSIDIAQGVAMLLDQEDITFNIQVQNSPRKRFKGQQD